MVIKLNTLALVGFIMNDDLIFNHKGYLVCKNFIDLNTIQTISKYLENKIARGEWPSRITSEQEASAYAYYADPLIEVVLKEYLNAVEEKINLNLEPTYSFARVYQETEELKVHTDRPSCEISVSVNVARLGDKWPLWMQHGNNTPTKFELETGDAVIYKGCDVKHWRTPLPKGGLNVQFMLHYVDLNGPYKNFKFDQREKLGFARREVCQ